MSKRRKPLAVKDPMCAAPNCPLHYRHAASNGHGWCHYHYGVQDSERVSEITRRLYVLAPVRRQLAVVNRLLSSPVLQQLPYECVDGLPDILDKRSDESFKAWYARLQAHIDIVINQEGVA